MKSKEWLEGKAVENIVIWRIYFMQRKVHKSLIPFSLQRFGLTQRYITVIPYHSVRSMDMGEALDVNRELATVGVGNLLSGCLIGFTGSYIFSQTIFTYRTGCRSKWVGIFIMIMFVAVVVSKINFLSVLPLFFLGGE